MVILLLLNWRTLLAYCVLSTPVVQLQMCMEEYSSVLTLSFNYQSSRKMWKIIALVVLLVAMFVTPSDAEFIRECYRCSWGTPRDTPEPFTDKCQDPTNLHDYDRDFIQECAGPCLKEKAVRGRRQEDEQIIIRRCAIEYRNVELTWSQSRDYDEDDTPECFEKTKSDGVVYEICPCFEELCNDSNSNKSTVLWLIGCTVAAKLLSYWF